MSVTGLFQLVRLGKLDKLRQIGFINCINERNEYGQNLLHEAIASGQDEIGHFLLSLGIDTNCADIKGQTPLHYAATHGATNIAKAILAHSGKLDVSDKYGNEPLWTAVFNARGKYQIVELFLKAGADTQHKNLNGKSPEDFAHQIKDSTLIKMLA